MHIRRMNPRDTAHNMNRRRLIRRGAPYGPHLPEGAPDDGIERGIAAFVICASLIRQFEFAQNVPRINDRNFNDLGNEHDPIIGAQDGPSSTNFPSGPFARQLPVCRPSPPLEAARISFSGASRRLAIWRH